MGSPSTHKEHHQANHQDNLRKMKQLNQDIAIKNISKFEDYRRNYLDRFEWRHFKTRFDIPQAKK